MHQPRNKVVVTGGAGFIGSHLVDRLLATTPADVVVFDSLVRGRLASISAHFADPRCQFVQGDIRNASAVAHALRGARTVYHLAAESPVIGELTDLDDCIQTNVIGMLNVLRAARDCGAERVVFTSSSEVYGESITLPVDENAPLLAVNTYGASKVAGEAICRALRRETGLSTVVLRLATVYGPRDVGRTIPTWLHQVAKGEALYVYGGKRVIDVVWVGQVVEALTHAAELDGPVLPINIGSGTGTRILDLARRIVRDSHSRSEIKLQPARPAEVTRFVANVERMRELLQCEPSLDPLGRLPELLEWAVGVAA